MVRVLCLIEFQVMGNGVIEFGVGGCFYEKKGNQIEGYWEDILQNKEVIVEQEIYIE